MYEHTSIIQPIGEPYANFSENIDKIKEGTAEEVFNEYQAELEIEKEGQRKDAEAKARFEAINAAIKAEKLQMKMDRENSLAIVEALNESLEPKKSFWKKLFNL